MDILDILLDILLKPPQPFIGLFFFFTEWVTTHSVRFLGRHQLNILEPIDPGAQSRYRAVWIYHNSVHCYSGASLPMICLSGISVSDE